MGCSVGEYNMNALEQEDTVRIRKCERNLKDTLEEKKKQRKVRKRIGKGGEEQAVNEEGTNYEVGAFWTTFCKYFLGEWLEMCSFFHKIYLQKFPKSDPPDDFVKLHDFSVVVGQTPTKVYTFGNCD